MTLRHVQRGDPFPTEEGTVNAWTEAGMAYAIGRGGTGEGDFTAVDSGIVLVKNTSGAGRNRFDVLGIDDVVFPSPTGNLAGFKGGPVLYGIKPDVDEHERKFVILLEPAKTGAIVPAAITGTTVAKVALTDTHHQYARIKHDDPGSMESAPAGYPILYRETANGVCWACLNLSVWDDPGVGFMLDENHPGRGIHFDVLVGTWDRRVDNHTYDYDGGYDYYGGYDDGWVAKAIDWFYADPAIVPAKCATGKGVWRRSDDHDWVINVWVTDCESPGCPSGSY